MGIISTQAFTFRLVANGTELDLFDDEDIKISNNVTGLFDIGQLPSDFTRQITLPGTKTNNAFFEHVYDISIDSPFLFATNVKVPAYFDFDSVYLSQGYLQLNKVNVIANKFIDSYEVTIYGTLSSFGRDINRLYLTDLSTLSKFNHTSSYDNISASWNGGLFNGDIVYPWADYGSGWQYTSGDDFFGVDDSQGGLSVQDYKPAIRVKKVWDAIFEETGYTYSSSFLAQSWLDDVYMICNNQLKYPVYSDVDLETFGVIKIAAISGSGTDLYIPMNSWTTLPWANELENPGGFINNGLYTVTKKSNLSGVINLNFNVSCSVNNLPGQINVRLINSASAVPEGENTLVTLNQYLGEVAQSRNGSINQTFELIAPLYFGSVPTGSYYFQIWMNEYYADIDPTVILDPGGKVNSYINIKKVNQAADGRVLDIPSNMPYGTSGIKLIDFIIGLQKKFNLVIYPDKTKPNQFIVETFNEWYKKGEIKDFNKYINLDETIEYIPANNLAVNKLNFGDTLDGDYISQQFAKGANREYGKQYYTDTTNFYSQGTYEVKTTFASSPLIKIAGTGLSGSIGGITPPPIVAYTIGQCKFSPQFDALSTCTSPILYQTIYSSTGTFTSGAQLYFDQYGNSKVTNFRFVMNGTSGPIYTLSNTGVIGSYTGFNC
jgi:hypothetical protein